MPEPMPVPEDRCSPPPTSRLTSRLSIGARALAARPRHLRPRASSLGRPLAAALVAMVVTTASAAAPATPGRALPRLRVSDDARGLVTEAGKPFVYLGDTAWELFHRLDRAEAARYLTVRAGQRFNVIQAVAIAEIEGLTAPNAHGDLPFVDGDPRRPAITPGRDPRSAAQYDYWDHVDWVIDEAERRGLYVALLPTWASWVNDGPFTEENAGVYGEFLGKRYSARPLVWILGGDRKADGFEGVWRALARGIATGAGGEEAHRRLLMTYHPPATLSSSRWFHGEAWLDFNMQQTGHRPVDVSRVSASISADWARRPTKPVLDGEPLYEDHPIRPDPRKFGYSTDAHVRQRVYWSVFAGGFGVTYGHHSVWQMVAPGRASRGGPTMYWDEALHRPAALQMQHLRALLESRPIPGRVPDPSLVLDALDGHERIEATRGDGYLFVYSAAGQPFTLVLGKIAGAELVAHWWNPRTGSAIPLERFPNQGQRSFRPPSEGLGSDWVLVVDDAARGFPPPGRAAAGGARSRSGGR
jgi:hypothetical protein